MTFHHVFIEDDTSEKITEILSNGNVLSYQIYLWGHKVSKVKKNSIGEYGFAVLMTPANYLLFPVEIIY